MSKTFTVITPAYNAEQYIKTCVEAIAKTTYDLNKVEHIIVDDGSTDRTKEICLELSKKYPHVKFYSKSNGNWGSVINYVKHNKLVNNDYVVVCDADDVILPEAFSTVDKLNNDADYCSGSFYLWDGKDWKRKVHSYYFLFRRHMKKNSNISYYSPLLLPHCSYLKKELFYSVIDLKEGISYQDNVLYLDSFRKAKTVTYIPKAISLYWQKRENNTMSNIKSEKGILQQITNYEYYSSIDCIEPFFYVLIGMKQIRKYLKVKQIKFNFKRTKLNLTGFPFYVRPILRLMYLIMVKKFVKKN